MVEIKRDNYSIVKRDDKWFLVLKDKPECSKADGLRISYQPSDREAQRLEKELKHPLITTDLYEGKTDYELPPDFYKRAFDITNVSIVFPLVKKL